MKPQLLLLALTVAALSSCTTAYKTGQTPDDVYYSPLPQREEYVRVEKEDDRQYRYDDEYYDDRYLRMKVRNRYQWNDLNDWYFYDRYSYGYNYYWGSYYNPYNSWNYYYNPYFGCHSNYGYNPYYYHYNNPKNQAATVQLSKPRTFNLNTYNNSNYNNNNNNANYKTGIGNIGSSRPVYNNSNVNSSYKNNQSGGNNGLSNTIRTIVTGGGNNSGGNTRTYSPSNSSSSSSGSYSPSSSSSSSSSSGSSGGSSGGGGGVSRPSRN